MAKLMSPMLLVAVALLFISITVVNSRPAESSESNKEESEGGEKPMHGDCKHGEHHGGDGPKKQEAESKEDGNKEAESNRRKRLAEEDKGEGDEEESEGAGGMDEGPGGPGEGPGEGGPGGPPHGKGPHGGGPPPGKGPGKKDGGNEEKETES